MIDTMLVSTAAVVGSAVAGLGLAYTYGWWTRPSRTTQRIPMIEVRPLEWPARGVDRIGWETRVVPVESGGWWWDAWHAQSCTQLNGHADDKDEAIRQMAFEMESLAN